MYECCRKHTMTPHKNKQHLYATENIVVRLNTIFEIQEILPVEKYRTIRTTHDDRHISAHIADHIIRKFTTIII